MLVHETRRAALFGDYLEWMCRLYVSRIGTHCVACILLLYTSRWAGFASSSFIYYYFRTFDTSRLTLNHNYLLLLLLL